MGTYCRTCMNILRDKYAGVLKVIVALDAVEQEMKPAVTLGCDHDHVKLGDFSSLCVWSDTPQGYNFWDTLTTKALSGELLPTNTPMNKDKDTTMVKTGKMVFKDSKDDGEPVNVGVGARFVDNDTGKKFLLASAGFNKVLLVRTKDGLCWNGVTEVEDIGLLTREEWDSVSGRGGNFTIIRCATHPEHI